MADHAIIRADYANWRPVQGRKVLQLIFEVPIEQTADVMEKLGVPMPGESKWCAVALLENGRSASERNDGAQRQTPKPSVASDQPLDPIGPEPSPINASTAEVGTSETPGRERRSFGSLPLSQQAALLCNDARFRDWLAATYHNTAKDGPEAAAEVVRRACGVSSRSELDRSDVASIEWIGLHTAYQQHITTRQYADSRR